MVVVTYTRTECGVDFKNHDITLAVLNMEDIIWASGMKKITYIVKTCVFVIY